jgi:hypothetical protein
VLRRARVDVDAGQNAEVLETGCVDEERELCLRQSAGDSTGPEVYLRLRRLRDRLLHQEIADLKTPSRL